MADETQQDTTQHDDVATEAAPETGAEFSSTDSAGSQSPADGSVQLQPADDAGAENATGAGFDAESPVENATTAPAEDPATAPGAEGGGAADGTDAGVGPTDAGAAPGPADEQVVAGFDAEPTDDAPYAEPASDDKHQSDGAAAVPAAPGGESDAPAEAPADASGSEPAAAAPSTEASAVDAAKGPDAAGGGDDVELPYNSTGMAKLGTAGHESGGPISHPAPARVPRPIDPTTGLELTEEQHELVTGGLHKGDEATLPEGFEEGDK